MTDPFIILGVDETATKKEIMLAVADALRDGRHNAKTIAAAQKMLFNPLTRAQAVFRYRVDFGPYAVSAPQVPVDSENRRPQLVRLIISP
ncbi:MAG: hypothetical protein KJO08_02415 [Gammaproteobacteria bacterium]|nr:hypothetical protein [Gammaproteobacteria bacterium]NNJ83333.1 hypothetical protein [Gammaproteobacteria bacterium]